MGLLLFLGTVLPMAGALSPEELVENLKKAAHSDVRTSQTAKEAVVETGPPAIPFLLPLLSDDDEKVRTLAGWVVSEIKGLSEEHLDILIQAYRRGVSLVGSGIVRIGSPRAVDFVVETLVSDSHADSLLIANGPGLLREKLVPGLVQFYRSDREWDDGLETRMARVFGHLRTNAKSAIGPLLEIANDRTISVRRRVRAIAALGAIGVSTEGELESLQRLQKDDDNMIRDAALEARAFIRVGDSFERTLQIRDLARQGTLAKHAGPDLVKDLEAEDWDVRAAAARAIGYIGFEDAIDVLLPLLGHNEDWRLVYSAAESLGRLRARKALPALAAVYKEYWYPPAREAANRATVSIRDSVVPTSGSSEETAYYDDEFFDRGKTGSDCITEKEAGSLRFPVAVTRDDLVSISVRMRGDRDEEKMRGVEVEDGYLVGSDRGEWGGETAYVDRAGKARILVPVNTEAIYKTRAGIVAVTGGAQMTFNSGCLFRISKTVDGDWSASKWRVLPGAPRFSRLLKDGNLFVSCHGGMVLIAPDGRMRQLTRQESGLKTQSPISQLEPAEAVLEDIP